MKTLFCRFGSLPLLFLLLGGATAADTPAAIAKRASADAPLVAEKIRGAMQDRHYDAAAKAIDESILRQGGPATTCFTSRVGPSISMASTTRQLPLSIS